MYLNSVHLQIMGSFDMWFFWLSMDSKIGSCETKIIILLLNIFKQYNWDQNLISLLPAVLFVVLLSI